MSAAGLADNLGRITELDLDESSLMLCISLRIMCLGEEKKHFIKLYQFQWSPYVHGSPEIQRKKKEARKESIIFWIYFYKLLKTSTLQTFPSMLNFNCISPGILKPRVIAHNTKFNHLNIVLEGIIFKMGQNSKKPFLLIFRRKCFENNIYEPIFGEGVKRPLGMKSLKKHCSLYSNIVKISWQWSPMPQKRCSVETKAPRVCITPKQENICHLIYSSISTYMIAWRNNHVLQ